MLHRNIVQSMQLLHAAVLYRYAQPKHILAPATTHFHSCTPLDSIGQIVSGCEHALLTIHHSAPSTIHPVGNDAWIQCHVLRLHQWPHSHLIASVQVQYTHLAMYKYNARYSVSISVTIAIVTICLPPSPSCCRGTSRGEGACLSPTPLQLLVIIRSRMRIRTTGCCWSTRALCSLITHIIYVAAWTMPYLLHSTQLPLRTPGRPA
jgi:hypothetical protein